MRPTLSQRPGIKIFAVIRARQCEVQPLFGGHIQVSVQNHTGIHNEIGIVDVLVSIEGVDLPAGAITDSSADSGGRSDAISDNTEHVACHRHWRAYEVRNLQPRRRSRGQRYPDKWVFRTRIKPARRARDDFAGQCSELEHAGASGWQDTLILARQIANAPATAPI